MNTHQKSTEQGAGSGFYQEFLIGNGTQNQEHHGVENPTPKINRFTSSRKELCRKFMLQNDLVPGSEIWMDELHNFFMASGQFGVTRDSIKVWYGRQPAFFQPEIPFSTAGGGGATSHTDTNLIYIIPQQEEEQEQTIEFLPASYPFQFEIPVEMPIQNPAPAPTSAPISAELSDYQQKREDYNNSFEYIRQLHNIFMRQENLATCLIHLESMQKIVSRANEKLVLSTKYKDNVKERLGALARGLKQETGQGNSSTARQENDMDFSTHGEEEDEDESNEIILS